MTVAYELDFETYRPRLYVVPDQPARTAASPRVRRRRVVVGAVVVVLLVLLALPDPRPGWEHPGPGGARPRVRSTSSRRATRWPPSPTGPTLRTPPR